MALPARSPFPDSSTSLLINATLRAARSTLPVPKDRCGAPSSRVAAPVSFDIERTLQKLADLAADAGRHGARLTLFPEAFVSAYPRGLGFGAVVGSRTPALVPGVTYSWFRHVKPITLSSVWMYEVTWGHTEVGHALPASRGLAACSSGLTRRGRQRGARLG